MRGIFYFLTLNANLKDCWIIHAAVCFFKSNYRTTGLEGMLDYLQLFLHFTLEEPKTQGTQVHLTTGDRKKVVHLQKVKRECEGVLNGYKSG